MIDTALLDRLRHRRAHPCPGLRATQIEEHIAALSAIPTAEALDVPAPAEIVLHYTGPLVVYADGRRESLADRIRDGIGRGLTLADIAREINPEPEAFRTSYSRVQRMAMRIYDGPEGINAAKRQARQRLSLIDESYEIVHAEDGDAHLVHVKVGRVTVATFRVELRILDMRMQAVVDVVKMPRQQVSVEAAEAISMALAEAAMLARQLDFEHEALR